MPDLNIPNLTKKSDKYLFRKRLTSRKKSKKKLLSESCFMLFCSFLLVYLNSLIPNKTYLFNSFSATIEKIFITSVDLSYYLFQIFLVFFILVSLFSAIVLFLGSFSRILKVLRIKNKQMRMK